MISKFPHHLHHSLGLQHHVVRRPLLKCVTDVFLATSLVDNKDTHKCIYEKLVFLSFSSELLNSSYWPPVLFTFFPLRQRDTFLGYLTEDCFLWELTLLRRGVHCLPQSLPFQQQFLVWPHQEPSSWLCYYLWVIVSVFEFSAIFLHVRLAD